MTPSGEQALEGGAKKRIAKEPEAFQASVLVVDDEPAFSFDIAEILRLAGYEVFRAHSATQAMEQLEKRQPDLILTDVMMPGIDGLTLVRRLRSNEAYSDIPMIAISAKAMKDDIAAAHNAGADAYLMKPFSAKDLQEIVRPFVNGNGKTNGH
jgi:CheY-like chemotaxis protein